MAKIWLQSFPITGFLNPVKCMAECLKAMGYPIDEESFVKVQAETPDIEPGEEGFIINSYEDLNRLCVIGNFNIRQVDGIFVAAKN